MANLLVVDTATRYQWLVRQLVRAGHRVVTAAEAAAGPSPTARRPEPVAVLCWDPWDMPRANRLTHDRGLLPFWAGGQSIVDRRVIYQRWAAHGAAGADWLPVDPVAPVDPGYPCVLELAATVPGFAPRWCHDHASLAHAMNLARRRFAAGTPHGLWHRLREHDLPQTLVLRRPPALEDGPTFTVVFAVAGGRPTQLGVLAEHRRPQGPAGTGGSAPLLTAAQLLPPLPGTDQLGHARSEELRALVAATGLLHGVCTLTVTVDDGRLIPIDFAPGLPDPITARALGRVSGVDLAAATVAVACGHRAPRRSETPGPFEAVVLPRAGADGAGRRFDGLDLDPVAGDSADLPEVVPLLRVGDVVPATADEPVLLAQVAYRSPDPDRVASYTRWLTHPERIHTSAWHPGGTARPGRLVTGTHGTLADPALADWDDLASDHSLYSSAGWLRAVEHMTGFDQVRYLTVRDRGGGLLGALACWRRARHGSATHDPMSATHAPAGSLPPAGSPSMLVGSQSGYTAELLIHRAVAATARRDVVDRLLDAVEELAGAWRTGSGWLLYATDETVRRVAHRAGAVLPVAPETAVDLGPGSFPDWLERFPAKLAGQIRREATEPLDLRRSRLGHGIEETARLLATQMRRHGARYTTDDMLGYLQPQATYLGAHTTVFTVHRDGRAVAYSCGIRWGDAFHVRTFGAEDATPGTETPTFRLLILEPVRYAIERGLRQVTLGPGTYQGKLRRGCRLVPRWAVHLGGDVDPAWHRAAIDADRHLRAALPGSGAPAPAGGAS